MSTNLTWISYEPNADAKKIGPHRRRSHAKSRGGCIQCKRRRIKCDEQHPRCGQCTRRIGSTCSYAEQRVKAHSSRLPPPQMSRKLSEVDDFGGLIGEIAASQGWRMFASNETYVELLNCFQSTTVTTLGTSTWQRIMVTKGVNLIQDYPFFLHAILALTACHMSCASGRELAAIGLHHAQRALHLYSRRLQQVTERKEMDAMLPTCFMLTVLFYLSHDQVSLTNPWMTPSSQQDSPSNLHWATILSGPTTLLARSAELLAADGHESLWSPFTSESQQCIRQAAPLSGPGHGLVSLLYDLCSGSHSPANRSSHQEIPPDSVYRSALNALAPALEANFDDERGTVQPCTDVATYVLVMSFPSRLDSAFISFLSRGDSIAFLLVGFWFALLRKLQHCQWWCLQRALTEGQAICSYLKGLPADPNLGSAISLLDNMLSGPAAIRAAP